MTRCLGVILRIGLAILVGIAAPAAAQPEDTGPAFNLSSSQVFTTRESPSFYLTFRQLSQLDFRVYKVRDVPKFFAGLSNPHQLGSYGSVAVPVEKTWLERLTEWKRTRRREVRTFVRDQVSADYRAAQRAASEKAAVAQRVTLNTATFALVPLLNPEQLVTSWREVLPSLADSEMRRLPLDVTDPGVYVVEAVSGALRAYTIVMVTDIGLLTKVSPQETFVFAANRLTGEPRAGCEIRIVDGAREAARGVTDADGILRARAEADGDVDDMLTLARCDGEDAVSSLAGYSLAQPARELLGYVYTDKPVYRPGHTVHLKGVLRWRDRDALAPFDRGSVELRVSDVNDKVIARQSLRVDEFGAAHASLPIPESAALGDYSVVLIAGALEARGSFSVEEYRRPEFEVIVTPVSRFVVQGAEAVADVRARYYFGQPVANATVKYVVNTQAYSSPYRWGGEDAEDDGDRTFTAAANRFRAS